MKMNYSAILRSVFSVLLALTLTTGGSLGAAIPGPTIDNPCMIDPTTSSSDQEYLPLPTQITETITTANAASDKAQTLKEAFVKNYHLTQEEADALNNIMYNLPGLPLSLNEAVSDANKINLMKQAYNDISVFIVYFQMAKTQQVAFDEESLVPEMQAVLDNYFALLCGMDMALRSQNVIQTEFVDSFIIPDDIKNMSDNKQRYQRDYLLTKNAQTYLSSLVLKYAELRDVLPSGK